MKTFTIASQLSLLPRQLNSNSISNIFRYKKRFKNSEWQWKEGRQLFSLNLMSSNFSSSLLSSTENEKKTKQDRDQSIEQLMPQERLVPLLSNYKKNFLITQSYQFHSLSKDKSRKINSLHMPTNSVHGGNVFSCNVVYRNFSCPVAFSPSFNAHKSKETTKRHYSTSSSSSSPTLILIGAGLCTSAYILSLGLKQYEAYQVRKANEPTQATIDRENEEEGYKSGADTGANEDVNYSKTESHNETGSENLNSKKEGQTSTDSTDGDLGNYINAFTSLFDFSSKRYYEGGFEDKMTRREAALILGVRESANAKRIKAQHKKILILNHPDRGGSTYIATKVNEAKELLLKGKE